MVFTGSDSAFGAHASPFGLAIIGQGFVMSTAELQLLIESIDPGHRGQFSGGRGFGQKGQGHVSFKWGSVRELFLAKRALWSNAFFFLGVPHLTDASLTESVTARDGDRNQKFLIADGAIQIFRLHSLRKIIEF